MKNSVIDFNTLSNVSIYKETYLEAKSKNKLDIVSASILVFKSCVGIGYFSYPFIFSKAGASLGTLLSIFICYFSTYGMYSLARNSRITESKLLPPGKKVNDYNGKTLP